MNAPPIVIDPATKCPEGIAEVMHYDERTRSFHNVRSQVTIADEVMDTWIFRHHCADIECSHVRNGIYDGVIMPQYCKDPILVLRLHASNGEWRYKRIDHSRWGSGIQRTEWRWPD